MGLCCLPSRPEVSLFSRGLNFGVYLRSVCFTDINEKSDTAHMSRERVKTKWRIHQSLCYRKYPENRHFPRGNSQSRRHQLDIDQILLGETFQGTARRILRLSFDNWIMRKKFTTLPLFPRSLLKKSVSYPVCRSPNPFSPLSLSLCHNCIQLI